MKFLYRKLYRKYFPIKNRTALYEMNEKECSVLARWIKNIEKEILLCNFKRMKNARRLNLTYYIKIELHYSKPIGYLCSLLRDRRFLELDGEDLQLINDVLIMHKFIWRI